MNIIKNKSLKELNAFKLDVYASEFLCINSIQEFNEAINYIKSKPKKMIIGEASNILFLDNFDGLIIKNDIKGSKIISNQDDKTLIEVSSGEIWDEFVSYIVNLGYGGGIENLAFIPGKVGSAVVQNIGAYGVELKDILHSIKAYSFKDNCYVNFNADDLNFGYRNSFFKQNQGDFFIVSAVFLCLYQPKNFILSYGGVKNNLKDGAKLSPKIVYDTIKKIRQEKLPDHKKIGNCGSFFKNPVIEPILFDKLKKQYPNMPYYLLENGYIKIPAAWLIENCGLKGYSIGGAEVYKNHALILINNQNASPKDIEDLAKKIILDVKNKFFIELEPEVIFV